MAGTIKRLTQAEYDARIAALPLGPSRGNAIKTNAGVNRDAAIKAHGAGRTAEEIAAHWPEVWSLVDGKLAQLYDYRFRGTAEPVYECSRMITSASVRNLCKRNGR